MERIGRLAKNPRPAGYEQLNRLEFYRLQQGRYRVVYSIQDEELTDWVVKAAHRKMRLDSGTIPVVYYAIQGSSAAAD